MVYDKDLINPPSVRTEGFPGVTVGRLLLKFFGALQPILDLLTHSIWDFRMILLVVNKVKHINLVFKKITNQNKNVYFFLFLVAAEKYIISK